MKAKLFLKGAISILLILVIVFVILDILVIGGGSAALGSMAGAFSREGTPSEDGRITAEGYSSVDPSGIGCANVPLFRQNEEPWKSVPYGCGGTTVGSSGCGIASASMVLRFYSVNTNPEMLAELSLDNGFRACGSGTAHDFFPFIALHYGLSEQSNVGWNAILENLNYGRPVIVSGRGSAPFTSGGHYVVLTCYNEDGTISVNDPYRGLGVYDAGIIQSQMHFSSLIYQE